MKLRKLREAFEHAQEKGHTQFQIEGHEFVTKYAQYMLEHLKNKGLEDDTEIELVPN